ncbi:MAG: ATP-binding protein, partial [Deltaproteobacteria bacterium]|nr:ATP-binding protein [Deltaproteobacteria bacterium]
VIGEFGSGKSFFLQLIRAIALEKGLVTLHADLAPDRRLYATGGQARNLYAELLRNCSTRTKQDGNALTSVVERFITEARKEADARGGNVGTAIEERLSSLSELVGGYDFAKVIEAYWQGHESGNDQLKADAVRWLRGEFTTKTDARNALGVRTIVDDASVYDHFKLLALFVRQAGYAGLLINLDEMVNLYKLSSQKARTSNYEQILRMLNDCLQGSAEYIGFLLGGTPDFLLDPRKGLYSYEALQSRLAENSFARAAGVIDYSSPSLHLASLTPEELLILLRNLRHVFASGDESKYLVPDDALTAFLAHCSQQIGDAYFRTPRNTVKAFVDLLSVLEQGAGVQWNQLIGQVHVDTESNTDMPDVPIPCDEEDGDDGSLATFRL